MSADSAQQPQLNHATHSSSTGELQHYFPTEDQNKGALKQVQKNYW